jgi:4-amino-4-deoxy-L-arabinose transferase-like glycosyltransferase
MAVLATVMLATFLDYGMTGDEGVQHRYGRRLLRWYATLGGDRGAVEDVDVSMYGGLFEIAAESAIRVSPQGDPYETRHLVNLAFALVAFVAVHRIASRLAGPAAGFTAALCLALTPAFYGHAFNNPKDIPFASLYALAVSLVLSAGASGPLRFWRAIAAGVGIGLACGVRVGGVVLYAFALVLWLGTLVLQRPKAIDVARTVAIWAAALLVGWAVMLAFWPWAQVAPLSHPLRALRAFHGFWETMVLFYDGRLDLSGEVSRFYLPKWFALSLPEFYAIAGVLGILSVTARLRREPLGDRARLRLWEAISLAGLAVVPVSWVVLARMPLYDGLRHFLFVIPILAALAGVSIVTFLKSRPAAVSRAAAAVLVVSGLVTLGDMIALHPYQTVYFNRLVAGGLPRAWALYETDYWCLSYKEGLQWLVEHYRDAPCQDKIRVAGHSILLQLSYYLDKTAEGRRLFKAVNVEARPHIVLATTRYGDHNRTPGRVLHRVERQGAPLLWIFEREPPPCRAASPAISGPE